MFFDRANLQRGFQIGFEGQPRLRIISEKRWPDCQHRNDAQFGYWLYRERGPCWQCGVCWLYGPLTSWRGVGHVDRFVREDAGH